MPEGGLERSIQSTLGFQEKGMAGASQSREAQNLAVRSEECRGSWTKWSLLCATLLWSAGCGIEFDRAEEAGGGGATGGPPPPNAPPGTLADVEAGDIIGEFEVVAGEVQHFPLHGTLPLPKGTYPRPDGLNPFTIVDEDDNVYPTQTEIVSRYANDADGADVVEILSRVTLPNSTNQGDRVRYKVMFSPLAEATPNFTADVNTLFATPQAVLLRTTDCFGHEYTADLLADIAEGTAQTLKSGAVCEQMKTFENLMPVSPLEGPTGTLPHLMGVHSYVSRWTQDDFVSLDLRIHNGHSGLDKNDPEDDPLGKLYFRSLELRVPLGWSVVHAFENPYVGAPYVLGGWKIYPIVAPIPTGQLHVMRQQAQFLRRLVICRDGYEPAARSLVQEHGLGFCRQGTNENGDPYYSWWNPWTGRYFPQNVPLPDLAYLGVNSIRNREKNRFDQYHGQLTDGVSGPEPIPIGNLGWAHPYGVAYGGMHGGTEIWQHDGVMIAYAASHDGYRKAQLVHRMYTDRQNTCLYNADGEPTQHDQWIVQGSNGPFMPAWMFMRPLLNSSDPFGFNSSPSYQRDYVDAQGLAAPYEAALLHYSPIDIEHLIRYTRNPKVLTWLGNDSLAKDDLRMQAELWHFTYNDVPQSNNGAVIGTGLLYDMTYADEHPGWGVKYGRSEGWGLDAMTAYYAVATPEWRTEHLHWFHSNMDMLEKAQSDCDGTITASSMGHMFGGQYRNRQSIEACIVENAIWSMSRTVFEGADETRRLQADTVLLQALYGMVSAPVWSDQYVGPWSLLAVGPHDTEQPPFCGVVMPDGVSTGADRSQIWPNFAYGAWLSGDPLFLQRATDCAQFRWSNPDLLASLKNRGYDNINNTIPLLTLLQSSPNPGL